MKRTLVFPAVLLFAGGAFAQTTTNANLSSTDRQFMEKAAQINMAEAHLGKVAQEKASSQDVKQFGEQLRTGHTQAYERLTKIANDKGVDLAKNIDSEHQSHVQRFENLSGEEFDREFRQHQVQDHEKAIKEFQDYANSGQDNDLKAYASEMIPNLQNHLQQAQNLGQSTTAAAVDRTTTLPTRTPSPTVAPDTTTTTGTTGSADRTAQPEESSVHYGTVTKYQSGKTIELKMRDRAGRHSYSLEEGTLKTDIPADIKVGSQVRITEKVDPNGHRSIKVEADTMSTAGRPNQP